MGIRIVVFMVLFGVLASSCRRSVQDAVESNTPIDRPILLEASVVSDSSFYNSDSVIYTHYLLKVREVLFNDGLSVDSLLVFEMEGGRVDKVVFLKKKE